VLPRGPAALLGEVAAETVVGSHGIDCVPQISNITFAED
jgi:hypothetical protein